MSFTAFGRGCEQASSSPTFTTGSITHQTGTMVPNGSSGTPVHINGSGHSSSNGIAKAVTAVNVNGTKRAVLSLRTTLSSGVSIKGTVKFRNEVELDGDVEGTIESVGRLTVGKNGRVRGDIQTRSVTVHGTVDGNLSVDEKCELRSGCTLRGDIETSRLVVDENVNFTGSAAIATRDYLSELRPLNGNGHKPNA
jgi:cytoskeletal protein CcmA (bactofilin family)